MATNWLSLTADGAQVKASILSSRKQPDLSIVIPAYCEERRLGRTLDELALYLKHSSFFRSKNVEVLVVAADAPDKTKTIALEKGAQFAEFRLLMPGPRVGKGRDVQYGMLKATGRKIIFMDADLATPLHHLERFYQDCEKEADIVIGTRNLLTYRENPIRGLFAYAGGVPYRLTSGIKVFDSQCGFKIFTKKACQLCFGKLTIMGWGFDIEVLAIARSNHLSIKALRIDDWTHMPFSTYSENILQITRRMLTDYWKVTRNRLHKAYK